MISIKYFAVSLLFILCISSAHAKYNPMDLSVNESDFLASISDGANITYDAKVNEIGKKIAKVSFTEKLYRYNFRIIETSKINAYSLGNGFIYLTRGILDKYKEQQDELTFVIAHEVAHTALRHHANENMIKRAADDFAGRYIRDKISGNKKNIKEAEQIKKNAKALGSVMRKVRLGFDREQEYEADKWAIFYMSRLGYPLMTGVHALRSLKEVGRIHTPADEGNLKHPTTPNRISKAFEAFAEISHAIAEFDHGEQYLYEGKHALAIESFKKFLQLFPDSPEALNNVGLAYAIIAFSRVDSSEFMNVVSISSFDSKYLFRGDSKIDLNMLNNAEEHLQAALKINNEYAPALNNIAVMYARLGDLKKARVFISRSIESDGDNAEYINNQGYILALLGNMKKAGDNFSKAFNKDPALYASLFNAALADYKLGKKESSYNLFRQFQQKSRNKNRKRTAKKYTDKISKNVIAERKKQVLKGERKAETMLIGIQIGMSKADVVSHLGEAEKIKRRSGEEETHSYDGKSIIIQFVDNKVGGISINWSTQYFHIKTQSGIGLGAEMDCVAQYYGQSVNLLESPGRQQWNYPAYNIGFVFEMENKTVINIILYQRDET